MSETATTGEYVLRALGAAEIAENCNRQELRQAFFALAGDWLKKAEEAGRNARPAAQAN